MATIKSLASPGPSRTAGKWRREATTLEDGRVMVRIFHYRHEMLCYVERSDGGAQLIDYSIGHGSVSDQGGMNTLFRALGLPYYFSRKGGADVRGVA